MVLTYRSTVAESFSLIGQDTDGSRRVATAVRVPGSQQRYDLALIHPSGRTWQGSFTGANVLDALSEMLHQHDSEYRQEKNRGHKPEPPMRDVNRSVFDGSGSAPIVRTDRDRR